MYFLYLDESGDSKKAEKLINSLYLNDMRNEKIVPFLVVSTVVVNYQRMV